MLQYAEAYARYSASDNIGVGYASVYFLYSAIDYTSNPTVCGHGSSNPSTNPTLHPIDQNGYDKVLASSNACAYSTTWTSTIFNAPYDGKIKGISLVYNSDTSEAMTCNKYVCNGITSKWGCPACSPVPAVFMIEILNVTDPTDYVGYTLYPNEYTQGFVAGKTLSCSRGCTLAGYDLNGQNIYDDRMEFIGNTYSVTTNDQFMLQIGEACCQWYTFDNAGHVCATVYFLYDKTSVNPSVNPTIHPSNSTATKDWIFRTSENTTRPSSSPKKMLDHTSSTMDTALVIVLTTSIMVVCVLVIFVVYLRQKTEHQNDKSRYVEFNETTKEDSKNNEDMKEDTSNDNEDSANDSNHIITPMMERKTLALANSQATEHKNKIGVEIDPYPVQSMQPIVMPPIAMPMINNQCESGDSVTKSHDDDGLCDKQTASIDINLQALDAYDYRTVIHTKEDSKNGDEDMKEDSRNDNEDSTEDSTEYNIEGIDTLQALNDYHISYEQYADEAQRFPRCDDDTCVAFRRTFRNRADFQNEHTLRTIYGCEHNEECTCIAQYQILDTIHC
eukprot:992087_1